MESYMVDNCG